MISKISNFNTYSGANCLLSSFANVITYSADSIDDSIIFFNEEGFHFKYSLPNAINKEIKNIELSYDCTSLMHSFLERFNVKHEVVSKPYDLDIEAFFSEKIDQNQPFLTFVNSSYLDYSTTFTTNSSRMHVLVIIGICKEGVIVSDCCVPKYPRDTYEGILSFDKFRKAWAGMDNKMLELDSNALSNINIPLTLEYLCSMLKKNLEFYLEINNNDPDITKLHKFADDIADFSDIFSENEIRSNASELSYRIQFEGLIYSRELMKKFIEKIFLFDKSPIHKDSLKKLQTIIQDWYLVTFMVLKSGFKPKKEVFLSISERIKKILADEMLLFTDIYYRL